MTLFDNAWINATLATGNHTNRLSITHNQYIGVKNARIVAIDSMANFKHSSATHIHNVNNKLITPGLIDCHTHLIYGGSRANEIERRLNKESYASIAQSGGGINATIATTRSASFDELYHSASERLAVLIKEGVSTIEIKTGYGLSTESEIKMLQVMAALEKNYPVDIEKTFLGAHTVPNEYQQDADAYIDYICNTMLDNIYDLGLATSVDAFCEQLAFTTEQTKRVFEKAQRLGLSIKLHAEQLSMMGATKLACEFGALSVDHLEYCDEASVVAMKKSGTTAVLLPGAYYFLQQTKLPPINLFRKHGVPMAVASDLNPGTSALCSLQLMLNMSTLLFGLTVDEAFLGVTKNAALALGLAHSKGILAPHYDADFCIWNTDHPREFICAYMPHLLDYSVKGGKHVSIP